MAKRVILRWLGGVCLLSTTLYLIGLDKPAKHLPHTPINLAFTCQNEVFPEASPEAEQIFQAARALERQHDAANLPKIAELYREAIALNHPKAMLNFQYLLNKGDVPPQKGMTAQQEMIELNERLMAMNVPSAFYFMGYYVEHGIGVERNFMNAMRFYRKAADLGNPEAQYYIGRIFNAKWWKDQDNQAYYPEIGQKMLACAANQGHSEAALTLAGYYKLSKQFDPSLLYYQKAAEYGYDIAVRRLIDGFSITDATDAFYLGQKQVDEERVRRYRLIEAELDRNERAVFPDIDKIVPLPPAELPEWDGTFEYHKTQQQSDLLIE